MTFAAKFIDVNGYCQSSKMHQFGNKPYIKLTETETEKKNLNWNSTEHRQNASSDNNSMRVLRSNRVYTVMMQLNVDVMQKAHHAVETDWLMDGLNALSERLLYRCITYVH